MLSLVFISGNTEALYKVLEFMFSLLLLWKEKYFFVLIVFAAYAASLHYSALQGSVSEEGADHYTECFTLILF